MCFIITSCSNHKANSNNILVEKQIFDENKYEFAAIKSDKQGIDKSTAFQLTSKEKVNKKYIEKNLKIIPEQKYKIEEISSTVHNIIPLNALANDKVYQVKLNDSSYVYSWAFQTKKKFEVESTLPTNDSSYVPENSGIEMYFTLGSMDEIDSFFEIKPHVDGKFIQNEKSVIFVPEKLINNTRYTVTVKKGFGVKNSDDKLEQDYSFSFNTYAQSNSYIYFSSPVIAVYEKNPRIIEGYVNTPGENTEYSIDIYRCKDADAFAKHVSIYADTGKISDAEISDAVKLNTLKQKPFVKDKSYNNKALFRLPDELDKGYYVLEFYIDGYNEKYYQFLQINDMMVFNAMFSNDIVVMAADCKNSYGIQDAEVVLNGEKLGKTDKNGVLSLKKDTSVYNSKTICMKVKAEGYNDFIYADNFYSYYDYYYEEMNNAYKYLRYIDTDRPVYLPTDNVNVWGFARYKDDKSVNKLKIELVELDTGLVLDSKLVNLTDIGTYQTEFELKNITSDNCVINVYDNKTKISAKYISIGNYTKPLFKMNGELDKKYVYSGEHVNYKIKGNFFDGYPVSDLDINVNSYSHNYYGAYIEYEGMDIKTKLDANGENIINVNTNLKSSSWKPVTVSMNCWNGKAEDKTVSDNDEFTIFPKHKMLEIEQKNKEEPQSLDILFHELDDTKYKGYDYYSCDYMRGKALDGSISIEIYENYYEKVKVGERYDYINKVNIIDYDYNLVENKIYSDSVNTVGGIANINIPEFREDRNYKIIAYYEDGNGGIKEEKYVGGRCYYDDRAYYNLKKSDEKGKYRFNENINLQLEYDEKNVEDIENDKLMILLMRDGFVDYKVFDNTKTQFAFEEKYMPNVMPYCLYIKNGYMYPVEFTDGLYYDKTEKQIHFDVTTDKENYRPGEEVKLNVKAYDENKNPCVADVNISVVDEAYFSIFDKQTDTLDYLYQYVWNKGLNKIFLSNMDSNIDEGGAEKGGGGGEDTALRDEFCDTNIFKTVTTDKNGNASMKFKLADNLTSWRITYQGISDKQYAGSGTKNITVSLPFFVDLIMGKEYLKEDKICATLRVFGSEAKKSETVNYKITVKDKATGKQKEYKQTGVVGDYTNIFLDRLNEGNYEIYVSANCKGQKDAIKEEFNVVESSIYFNNTSYYKLSDSTVLNPVYSNPVITLFNESSSDFYNSLNNISSGVGKRIDQKICQMAASKYINENFESDLHFDEDEMLSLINEYESEDGGYKLLPYSNEDAEITAKLIHIVNNDYLNAKTKTYFKNILDNTEEYDTKIAASLWGLSKIKEPVLLTVYNLLENNKNLELRDKLYLALSLAEFGDEKTARKYYREFIEQGVKSSGDYLYFDGKKDLTDSYELTALLSVLGVKLKDFDNSDKLFKYLYNKPLKTTLSNFEQLIYIMNRDIMSLKEIQDLFGEITVAADGSKKAYKLKLFDRESFAVTKDKIKDISFSNIKGSIACKVEALGNKDDLDRNKTDDFSLNISYMLKDSTTEQMQYNHSDLVKVKITPSFSSKISKGFYEITYVIPSGFRYVGNDRSVAMWPEINGQKVIFNMYFNRENLAVEPAVFYIQASQQGEYTVDYVVIKEFLENKLNYINKMTLKVN